MDKDFFQSRFQQAAALACELARRFIEEPLPDEIRCRLCLNSSYDGNPLHEDERLYPEDSLPERWLALASISVEEATGVLWRDGRIREWINVAVSMKTARYTVLRVESCGRFTSHDDCLYHASQRRPPFHVLGPSLPAKYVNVGVRLRCRLASTGAR